MLVIVGLIAILSAGLAATMGIRTRELIATARCSAITRRGRAAPCSTSASTSAQWRFGD
jgi:hypothetical protein